MAKSERAKANRKSKVKRTISRKPGRATRKAKKRSGGPRLRSVMLDNVVTLID